MDKNEINIFEFKSNSFNIFNNKYRHFLELRKTIQSIFIKKNKKINNKASTHTSKIIKYVRYNNPLLKKVENFFLITSIIIFILLSTNGILCDSFVILKINKTGRYKMLNNEGVGNTNHPCRIAPNLPTRMTINENEIDPTTRKYDFNETNNTIKLYYEDSNNDFRCLFYGCSDIDEIDASHLNTSNAKHMEFMFYRCSSLTSLTLSNINTEKVVSMRSMFNYCSSLTSIDVSSFITTSVQDMAYMFEECSKLASINLSNFDTSNVLYMDSLFK